MKAPLPYHFCTVLTCHEMVPPGSLYCPHHGALDLLDAFLPGAESLVNTPADASQEQNQNQSCPAQQPVTGDAGIQKESQS